ncbi:hypothetical protein GWI33_011375, partial [Rhynchophorus ferrugineus]
YYHRNVVPAQPETIAIMEWMKTELFILSASLHGGAIVANYPFDTIKEKLLILRFPICLFYYELSYNRIEIPVFLYKSQATIIEIRETDNFLQFCFKYIQSNCDIK